jgi:hypothetical protein
MLAELTLIATTNRTFQSPSELSHPGDDEDISSNKDPSDGEQALKEDHFNRSVVRGESPSSRKGIIRDQCEGIVIQIISRGKVDDDNHNLKIE